MNNKKLAVIALVLMSPFTMACPNHERFEAFEARQVTLDGPLQPELVAQKYMETIELDGEKAEKAFGHANRIWEQLTEIWRAEDGELYALTMPKTASKGVAASSSVDGYIVFVEDCAAGVLMLPQARTVKLGGDSSVFERCLPVGPGEQLFYRFRASEKLHFNIHYHIGAETFYQIKEDAIADADDFFRPEKKQIYCLMWQVQEAETVDLELEYQVR